MIQGRDISAREYKRTQGIPVDLEHGKFEPDQIVKLWGLAVASLASGSFGGLLYFWGVGGSVSSWAWLASLSTWVAIFGALLCAISYAMALAIAVLAARGWWRHQQRIDDWHYAYLDAYSDAGGQEVERELRAGSLTLSEPLHLAAVVISVIDRANKGEAAPWSGKALHGPLWIGNARLGDLSKPQAEQFSNALAQLGLVQGRAKGSAGQLATRDMGEALALLGANYGKVKPGAPRRPQEGDENA